MRRTEKSVETTIVDLTTDHNSRALLRRRRRRRMTQPENEIPVITLNSPSSSQSIEEPIVKEVKVLLIDSTGVAQKLYTLDCPTELDIEPSCRDEIDVLTAVFSINPKQKIVKDDLGYKLVEDDSEQRIVLTKNHDPKCEIQYKIELKAPTMKLQQLDNFDKFWNNRKFSDVTICVGSGQKIHAHKIILANKSSVFDTIFTNIESKKIEIKDVTYNTMCELLLYIYRGKLSDDKQNENIFDKYSKILTAANKYRVENLKTTCEEKLSKILTTDNVLDLLLLANSENAINLKQQTIDFIVGRAEEIIELESYKNFVEAHPDVSIDVTRALVVKKRKN